jgi:shikimate kinase
MNPSSSLFLIGPTGAGKTSVGRRLASHYGLSFIDLDQEIERQTGVDIPTIFEIEGEAGFRQREGLLLDAITARGDILLATGAGAVLDPANADRLATRGFVVWLQASIGQQLERLERDTHRPLLAGTDRRARLQSMAEIREPRYRQMADLAIPGGSTTVATAGDRCIDLINHHWQRQPIRPSQTA